jgi:hypothetical protein
MARGEEGASGDRNAWAIEVPAAREAREKWY